MRSFISALFIVPVIFFSIATLESKIALAQVTNLFANPSAEIAVGKLPQSWATDEWGGTHATFTYVSGGAEDGNKFLTTAITKKGNGDAKWYPKHVAVTPGQTLTFSDWYKSDVKSSVEVEYTLANGSYGYIPLTTLAPSTQWKEYETTIVVPPRAKKLTVLHFIDRVGKLSVDNYSLTTANPTPPAPVPSPSVSVSNSPIPASQNIIVNTANQPLGGFVINAPTSTVVVSTMSFFVATSSTGPGLLTNVSLVDSVGSVVAGPVDATYDPASGKQKITFFDTVTFPVGTSTYMLKGKLPVSFANAGTLTLSTNPAQNWIPATSLPADTVTMNTMTVKIGTLGVGMGATPPANSISPGISGFTFATVLLDASQSSEDVRMASLPIVEIGWSSNLSGCQMFDGSLALNTSSRLVNTVVGGAKTTFNFDNVLHVPKGTIKTLAVKCNLSATATSSNTYQFATAGLVTSDFLITGDLSGTGITPTIVAGTSATMTVENATLSLMVDSSSPSYRIVSGGSTGQTVGVYKLRASNDTITLNKLGLKLAKGSANDITQVNIFSGITVVGTAVFGVGQTFATSTLSLPLVLPADTDVKLTIKVDFADIGTGKPGIEGDVVQIDPSGAEGNASSGVAQTGGSGATAGVRVYNSYPIFTYDTTGGTLTNGATNLLTLNVNADSSGDIGLYKLSFQIATSGISGLTQPIFFGPNGNVGTVTAPDSTGVVTVTFNNVSNTADATIGTGTSKQYFFKGTVTGLNPSGASVSVSLMPDTSVSLIAPAVAVSSSNLVWSPLATTTRDVNTNDWTNGHGLTGTIGFVRTLSN